MCLLLEPVCRQKLKISLQFDFGLKFERPCVPPKIVNQVYRKGTCEHEPAARPPVGLTPGHTDLRACDALLTSGGGSHGHEGSFLPGAREGGMPTTSASALNNFGQHSDKSDFETPPLPPSMAPGPPESSDFSGAQMPFLHGGLSFNLQHVTSESVAALAQQVVPPTLRRWCSASLLPRLLLFRPCCGVSRRGSGFLRITVVHAIPGCCACFLSC